MTTDSQCATEATAPRKITINNLDTDAVSQEPHIIVGGCGRSGATLLRVMLDTHPAILCGPESNLFTPHLLDLEWLAQAYNLKPHNLDVIAKRSDSRVQFADQFSYMARARAGKTVFAEKTPRNVLNLDWIFKHWPRAKFIHVIRDGRDVVASLKAHHDDGANPAVFPACVQRWANEVSAGLLWRDDSRYMEVRYESLVTTPETELIRAFQFIGVKYAPQCLEYYKVERDGQYFQHGSEALLPITTRHIGRWIKDLTEAELRYFWGEAGVAGLMRGLGYG